MPFSPEQSRYQLTEEEKRHLETLDHNQMISFFHEKALRDGLATSDPWSKDSFFEATETPASRQPLAPVTEQKIFSRTEIVNGREITFEANSEHELDRLVLNAFRVADAFQQPDAEQARDSQGRFTQQNGHEVEEARHAEEVVRQAQIELEYKTGRMDRDTFLRESGAVTDYIDREKSFTQSWADVTEAWLANEGRSWPGGDRNLRIIADVITANGWTEDVSPETLSRAFKIMRDRGTVYDSPQPAKTEPPANKYDKIQTYKDLRAQVRKDAGLPDEQSTFTSGGIWGSR